ncbi:thiamine diphosphokinase [Halobacillus yeomjeoni]|uniref:Thiamine diphosphokinase n=1 Tax=Halobacillus yeomjeoni TaxID=311194 RepID=A0A931HTL3_9BACI|nr:thiamine diphosphokinase [Halobacillus yeomjeoni]MBH0229129.1 thiamine diphosphokinase [Halobacillus yeomjeoni]MCA0983483.1 thiamine diphosphokinase [Halobacillus yeomjeoni]
MGKTVAVVGGAPFRYIPDLKSFDNENVLWIGADQGAEVLLNQGIRPDFAVGDFDSVTEETWKEIQRQARDYEVHPDEKDETDLELAINKALEWEPEHILLFGVTGGRIDHALANIQLLYPLRQKGIASTIIDVQNQLELVEAGKHTIEANDEYPYVSFLPMTLEVTGLTLEGFYYPLKEAHVPYGSTLCISNRLIQEAGTFSFRSGILLVIRSKDLATRG